MARTFAAHRFLLPFSIFVMAAAAVPASAGWLDHGNSVCAEAGNQYFPDLVPDGSGRAILVWQDYRTSSGNAFASRIGPQGSLDWLPGGISVSIDASPREFFGHTVPDGEGGAYIVWTDHRNGSADIYAQRIASSGARAWSDYGTAVATSAAGELFPAAAALEGGGLAVAWRESNSSGGVIRVQILGPGGTPAWAYGGITAASGDTGPPAVASDGAGGAIVFWPAGSPVGSSIRAQRFSADGTAMWGSPGSEVCSGADVSGQLGIAGSGEVSIWWQDTRGGGSDIFAQRIDASGSALWGASGLCVCEGAEDQWHPAGVLSGGDLVLAWAEGTGGDYGITAQKVAPDGTRQWGAGVDVCSAVSFQLNPDIAPDGAGGAVVVWQDLRASDWDIYSQRLGFDGSPMWDPAGTPVTAAGDDQCLPRAASDGEGGVFVVWEEWTSESNILCQRVASDGSITGLAVAQYSAKASEYRIDVEWDLQPGLAGSYEFIVTRSENGGEYLPMEALEIEARYPAYSFTDTGVMAESEYSYRIEAVDEDGPELLFDTGAIAVPKARTRLEQNWPNPFNPATTISFVLAEGSRVRLVVYDAAGRKVDTLADGFLAGGRHEIQWNGTDGRGEPVSSGVYFYRLAAGKDLFTRKMILLR